jgi:hypothetical protein
MFYGVNSLLTQVSEQLSKSICCEPKKSFGTVTPHETQPHQTCPAPQRPPFQNLSLRQQKPAKEEAVRSEIEIFEKVLKNTPVTLDSFDRLNQYQHLQDLEHSTLEKLCNKIRELSELRYFISTNCKQIKNYKMLLLQIEEKRVQLAITTAPNLVDASNFIKKSKTQIATHQKITITIFDEKYNQFIKDYKRGDFSIETHYIKSLRNAVIEIKSEEMQRIAM